MKPHRVSLLLSAAAFAAAGCATEPPLPSPEAVPAAPRDATEVIRFERRTLECRPSCDDFTVASSVFSFLEQLRR